MKNLIFASAFALSTLAISSTASANTYSTPATATVLNITETADAMKPKIKIRLSWNDGFSVEIEISFMTAPGGNDNATGTLTARAINESGISVKSNTKRTIDVQSWSWGTSNPSMLNGASNIVVTKGATLPDGRVINVGDRLVMNGNSFSIVSPRDAASGLPTGKRQ